MAKEKDFEGDTSWVLLTHSDVYLFKELLWLKDLRIGVWVVKTDEILEEKGETLSRLKPILSIQRRRFFTFTLFVIII